MRDILTSLVHAFRVFRTNPAFALAALAILTLGIGANTAIFSVVNSVLLKPLPFQDSDSVVSVFHVPPAAAFPDLKLFPVSIANYLDCSNPLLLSVGAIYKSAVGAGRNL